MTSQETAATFRQLRLRVLERGWLSSNNVLFAPSRGSPATVVDTGYVTHESQTRALVSDALGGAALERIVNTHLHSDHCGGNAGLQARGDVEAWIPEPGYDAALTWDQSRLSHEATGQACPPFRPHRGLADGERVTLGGHEWRIASAGGHDPDAIVLHQGASGVVISGDALWRERVAIVFPEIEGGDGFAQAMTSLDLIESLSPRVVIPGHGEPFCDVADAIARSRLRLQEFIRDPRRHLDYAGRALVMFHMLEQREESTCALVRWLTSTPVFRNIVAARASRPGNAEDEAERIIASLVAGRQLVRCGECVRVSAR